MRILPLFAIAAAMVALAPTAKAQGLAGQLRSYMAQQNIARPGMGEDAGELQGDKIALPNGVSVGKVEGLNPGSGCGGSNTAPYAVQVCMTLCNDTGRAVVITLPRGTALRNRSNNRTQSGVLADDVQVTIPPNQPCPTKSQRPDAQASTKGVLDIVLAFQSPGKRFVALSVDEDPSEEGFQITLGGYCLNEGMNPSEDGTVYELGPVLNDPDIRELLNMIGDRELGEDQQQILQTAIYSITEGAGLTPADRAALREF